MQAPIRLMTLGWSPTVTMILSSFSKSLLSSSVALSAVKMFSLNYLISESNLQYQQTIKQAVHTEKLQSKFSYCLSLFPHVRKAIRPIRSRVSCFFTCEPYGKLKFSFKAGWGGFVHRTSHRFASLKRANSFYSHFFHR